MVFFDYLHYFIFKFYSGYKEKGALSTSAGIVGGFQAANLITALMLLLWGDTGKNVLNKTWGVVVCFLFFQVTTYIRYVYKDRHSIASIEHTWQSKPIGYRKQVGILLYIYGIGSIVAIFAVALFHGSRQS